MTSQPWDTVMARVKAATGHLPNKDWERIQTGIRFSAEGLWDGASTALGGKNPDIVLKALCIVANISNPDEKTSSATRSSTIDEIIASAVKKASRTAKTRALAAYLASIWGNKKRGLECKGGAFSDPILTTTFISNCDNESLLMNMATDWIKKQQSGYYHAAWAIAELSSVPIDDAKVTRHILSEVLLAAAQKKNSFLDTNNQKLPSSEPWLLVHTPTSTSTQYSEQQEQQCWAFTNTNIFELGGADALAFSRKVLLQITNYTQLEYLYVQSTPGYGLGIGFIEGVLSRLISHLTVLAVSQPELFSDIEGEIMGLFFQMLPQVRKCNSSAVVPRGYVKVTGWSSDDSLAKTASAASQAARRSTSACKGVPSSLLGAHYPSEVFLEGSTDYLTMSDGSSSSLTVPFWKGEIFISMMTFFCTTNSATESTVIDEFFSSKHWYYYHHMSHTFVPSLYKFLRRFGSRPGMAKQLPGLHSKLMLLLAWAPHSHVNDFMNIIPLLVENGSQEYWYDMLHRIIDLPLLSHMLTKQGTDAGDVSQQVSNSALLLSLCNALLTPISTDDGGEPIMLTTAFWENHKDDHNLWIAEVESFPMGRKGVTMARYLPKILHKFLSAVSLKAKNDPCVIAGLVSLILRRYHMLALPIHCAKDVRSYLLQEATKLSLGSPHILHLVFEDLVSAVRQQYFKNPQYRCTHLTMSSALIASELISRVIRPQYVPNPVPLEEVQSLFDQILGSLTDVLIKLQTRKEIGNSEQGSDFNMFVSGIKLHVDLTRKRSNMGSGKVTVTGNRYLHENLKLMYTVMDAVECVDSLATALVSISVSNPTLVSRAVSACLVVSRCISQQVLPETLSPTITRLLSWIKSPTITLLAIHQPCPPQHSSNQTCHGNSNSVQMLLPRRANRAPELG
eukprot:TRINITY_DN12752_c0_g1_i2.p1 TRINITY_DN12752_c0_g1~~TRINITY_DN12752_c0_g1_i2.p1  ORF type:complete len:904 (+),score=123.16 TRINITY_DN12752_c0_g1_i2:62-2773(+)